MIIPEIIRQNIYSHGISLGAYFAAIIMYVILLISSIGEAKKGGKEAKYFAYFLVSAICLIVAFPFVIIYNGCPQYIANCRLAIVFSSVFGFALLFFFSLYLINDLRKRVFIIDGITYSFLTVCATSAIVFVIGLYADPVWFCRFDETGALHLTAADLVIGGIVTVILLFDFILALSCNKALHQRELLLWALFIFLPLVGFVIYMLTGEMIALATIPATTLMLYTNIHATRIKDMALSQKELTESKSKIMVSQIQPHFMYNALNSIYYLIGSDKEKAQLAISTFSDYLRGNVKLLKDDKPIPVEEEIKHVNSYVEIEKLRFGDKIKIVYDLKEKDFLIPPLTVQPLVENAVKHGVSKKRGGGTITLTTAQDDSYFYIRIKDDGVGFDKKNINDMTGESTHVGLYNVNQRLSSMVNGKLDIYSHIGEGTTCIITLPKEGQPRK